MSYIKLHDKQLENVIGLFHNCTPLLMTNIKVSPQDIKPLQPYQDTPLGHYHCWTHLDVGHPPRTLPLNPL